MISIFPIFAEQNCAAIGDKVNIPLGTIVAPHGGPTDSGATRCPTVTADSAPPIGKGVVGKAV